MNLATKPTLFWNGGKRRLYTVQVWASDIKERLGERQAFSNRGKIWKYLKETEENLPLYLVRVDNAGRIYTDKKVSSYRTFMNLFPEKPGTIAAIYMNQIHTDNSITTYKIESYELQ